MNGAGIPNGVLEGRGNSHCSVNRGLKCGTAEVDMSLWVYHGRVGRGQPCYGTEGYAMACGRLGPRRF